MHRITHTLRLTVCSILDNVLQSDLEHRGICLQLLRPSGEERNDELAALATDIVSQSVSELEDVLKKGLLKESDGPGIMSMIDSPQGYDSFKTQYGRTRLPSSFFLHLVLTLPFAVFSQFSWRQLTPTQLSS